MKKLFCVLMIILCLGLCLPKAEVCTAKADEASDVAHVINNVVFVSFDAQSTIASESNVAMLDKMYNTSAVSMRNYFLENSLGKYDVTTKFVTGNNFIVLDHSAKYYEPKYVYKNNAYQEINALGYDNRFFFSGEAVSPNFVGAKEHIDRYVREQLLVKEIALKLEQLTKDNLGDYDNDGVIDAFSILADCEFGSNSNWDSVLWPHMSYYYSYGEDEVDNVYYCPKNYFENIDGEIGGALVVNGLKLYNYNFLTRGYIEEEKLTGEYQGLGNIGVLCHEYLHNLGMLDYYSYNFMDYESVGELDILGNATKLPQYNLCYLRQKLGWLEEGVNILPIEKSGTYTLQAVNSSSQVKAYKLVLNDYSVTGEYYMLEMRSNRGNGFDSMLSGSGLVVYRVNEKNSFIDSSGAYGSQSYGNMYSPKGKEEIYVYRAGAGNYVEQDGQSYALHNGNILDLKYDTSMLGTTDKSIKSSIYSYAPSSNIAGALSFYNTVITTGSGENSGVALKNIKASADGKSVTFQIEFDDYTASVSENDYATIDTDLSNKPILTWSSLAREGNCYVLCVEMADGLIGEDDGVVYAKTLPTLTEMRNGEMSGYNALIHKKVPISFDKTNLGRIDKNCAVFVMFDDGERQFVDFVGVINAVDNPNFLDTVYENRYTIIMWIGIVVGGLIVLSMLARIIRWVKAEDAEDDYEENQE